MSGLARDSCKNSSKNSSCSMQLTTAFLFLVFLRVELVSGNKFVFTGTLAKSPIIDWNCSGTYLMIMSKIFRAKRYNMYIQPFAKIVNEDARWRSEADAGVTIFTDIDVVQSSISYFYEN